jgi:hypothetical protein
VFVLAQEKEICTHDKRIDVKLRESLESGVNL